MAKNSKGYDPNKDYSAAIEQAKASGASQAVINQLQTERQNKINDKYGGNEPTMYGSKQTYSQASSSGNTGAIKNAVNTYNQYSGTTPTTTDPWAQYAGTNFHQDAINAAQDGDWDAVIDYLSQREDKVAAQGGDNRGKTSAEIYAELLELYGQQDPTFEFDTSSRPTYNDNGMSSKIDAMLNQILNRDKFSYSAADDPLYKQYAAMYEREGTRAMNDAMASAAATAGGMNSYAMTAANQANNYYMAQLNDKVPELYQLAYEMYLQDIDSQVRDLGLLQSMDNTQYDRYRDTMQDWESDRNFAFDVYKSDVAKDQWQQTFDHTVEQDNIGNDQWQQTFDHTVGQDALAQQNRDQEWDYNTDQEESDSAYAKAMDLLNSGAMPDAEMLKQAGMTEDQAAAILATVMGDVTTDSGGTVSSDSGSDGVKDSPSKDSPSKDKTGGGYDNGSLSTAQVKEMQKYYGVTADGLWGKNSTSASGGLSADAAWAAYQKAKGGDGGYDAENADLYNAILNLGIGPVNEDTVWSIMQAGGIVEKNGGFAWANGWNKNNWQEKMRGVTRTGGIGLYAGINF